MALLAAPQLDESDDEFEVEEHNHCHSRFHDRVGQSSTEVVKISPKIVLVIKTKLNLLLNTSILWELCACVAY